jgi:signal transduction histidine kinase
MGPPRGTTRVLVVEDSPTQAVRLRKTLESVGFMVEVACDGLRGLEVLADSDFGLVLSDVVMPGLSGYDLCRRIKADGRGRDTPVILLTALREPGDIIQGMECGADNFISKPYETDHLIARIDAVLNRVRRSEEPIPGSGTEIQFMGRQFRITSVKQQALTFLASTFEDFVHAQRLEHASRLDRERQRLEAEAARGREELLRREKLALDAMLADLLALQQQLCLANEELDRKVGELERANASLLEMDRLRSDFLATMTHELRTPLNAILGFSELLACGGPLAEEQRRRYLDHIQSSGKALLAMIDDVLDSAKLEGGRMEVRVEEFSARDACESLAASLRPIAGRKGIALECRLDQGMPAVLQDPGRFRQIVSNLLSNAIKFTPRGGMVTLRAHADGGRLIVSVGDTGIGIAESDQEKVFERFRQVLQPGGGGDVLTREHQGTGLGLSIVRDLVRLLGGDICLDSQPGRGSRFTVRLPQRFAHPGRPEFSTRQRRVGSSLAGRVDAGGDRRPMGIRRPVIIPRPGVPDLVCGPSSPTSDERR